MQTGYSVCLGMFIVLLIAVTIWIVKTGKDNKKDDVRRCIIRLFNVATITCVTNLTATVTDSALVSNLAYSAYFASIDWLLISLLLYAMSYTKVWREGAIAPTMITIIAAMDTLSLMFNFKLGHCFALEPTNGVLGSVSYLFKPYELWTLHLVFSYLIFILTVIVLIRKIVRTSGFNRTKYYVILISIIVIVAVNAVFIILRLPVDVSLYLYVFAALSVAYFSLYYSPRSFVEYVMVNVTDSMECALFCFNDSEECMYYNDQAKKIYGAEGTKSIIEERFIRWKAGRDEIDLPEGVWSDIYVVDGVDKTYDIHFNKIFDKSNHYCGCYFCMYDITDEVKAVEEEKYRASHDALTGALTRDAFYGEARKIMEANPSTDFVIVTSNIKNFKIINDIFGVDVGDRILIKTADLIRANLMESACFARMEADRFALLMPKARYSEELFTSCMDQISDIVDSSLYKMFIKIGVYYVDDRTIPVAVMCDRAYLANASIRDSYEERIAYYGDILRREYMNSQKIISEFPGALAAEQFKIFVQPIVDSETKEVHLGEALVRWQHPEKGLCSPATFIDILENTGSIYKLDMYVWEQACKTVAKWEQMGVDDVSLSVNISVKDFFYIDVVEVLKGLVEKYGIKPSKINLEITESAFMTDSKTQIARINQLRSNGFKIEIDDFGSGYSSLNMLKELTADILKVDMNFMAVTEDEERSRSIVTMVIALAKKLDMHVITEGVETNEQVDYLAEAGCDMYQGYYFSKPMPLEEFEAQYIL